MSDERKCLHCGKLLKRRENRDKFESARDFRRRKFCDKRCSSSFQHSSDIKPVEAAPVADEEQNSSGKKTAIEILEEAVNNEKLDWVSRINAAKALAPYQSKKIEGGTVGKKGEKEEAAKKASTGRFAPAVGPKVVPMVKQG